MTAMSAHSEGVNAWCTILYVCGQSELSLARDLLWEKRRACTRGAQPSPGTLTRDGCPRLLCVAVSGF